MTATSSVHSQAFRFMEYFAAGVDTRTGLYSLSTNFPELQCNDLSGPGYALTLRFNPMNPRNSGFGIGWSMNLTEFTPNNRILSLHTGETYKQTSSMPDGTPVFRENKLDTFHFKDNGDGSYRVAHKSGLIEILRTLGSGASQIAVPHEVYAPSGHSIVLAYEDVAGWPMLKTVKEAKGTSTLLLIERNPSGSVVDIHLRPYDGADGAPLSTYSLKITSGELLEIVLPTEEKASWRVKYQKIRETLCVTEVDTPTGGHERLEYLDGGHVIPGTPARPNVPRVTRHYNDPGFEQPMMEVAYRYESTEENKGNNFFGHGAATSVVEGMDPLYDVTHTYTYGTTTELIDDVLVDGEVKRQVVRSIVRTFNRFHAQIEETTTQNDCVKREVTTYYAEDKPFDSQPVQFQLPKESKTSWRRGSGYREEVRSTAFDTKGNQTEDIQHNNVRTTYVFYPAAASAGCPADPEGFERNLKETVVYPAPVPVGAPKAPILCTRLTYRDIKSLPDSEAKGCLLPETESLLQVAENGAETKLQSTHIEYNETPTNAFLHGRPGVQTLTLGGKDTVTRFEYEKLNSALAGEAVLQTVETWTGFDHMLPGDPKPRHVQKVNTSQHSLNHGEPLLTFDDNDVSIRYRYDRLVRVISEEVAPDSDEINAARLYSYTLTSLRGGQAEQTMTDVKGVTTRTLVDGLNRPIYEERQDTDNPARANAFLQTFAAAYNGLGERIEDSAFDWPTDAAPPGAADEWPNGELPLQLTTRYEFNDWGDECCSIGPDGIKVFEEVDHVGDAQWREGPVHRSWRESADGQLTSGVTVTFLNAFEKPASIKRLEAAGDTTPYSEHLYEYDGLGRTIKETDDRDAITEYAYDHFDRMTSTILPGGAHVERRYAVHSADDLPIEISVEGDVLGTQDFDGLDRMISLTTGGRLQTFTYEDGQTRPATVTTALGMIRYQYVPQLNEEPWRRFLPGEAGEVEAEYEYDKKNARLTICKEQGLTLNREYYSTGEVKVEVRDQGGETHTMRYGTSQMGRQLNYTDVLDQVQDYRYDLAGRLVSTGLGTTQSTFSYDDLGRTEQIITKDGTQQQVTITLEYDAFDREIKRTFDLNGVIQEMTQGYNTVDLMVERTLKEGTTLVRLEEYGYDPRKRLTTYRCAGTQPPVDPYGNTILAQTFRFDPKDNLIQVLTTFPGGSNVAGYFYEKQDKTQLTRVTNNNPSANYPAELILDYDENGNLIKDEEGRTLTYDALNRLLTVSANPDETGSRFKYDPLNTLSGSSDGGAQEQRFYQNGQLANQLQEDASSTFLRGAGVVLAEHQAGADPKSLMLAVDYKNSVLTEVGATGKNSIIYSVYGYSANDDGEESCLRYNGELREVQNGGYFLGNGFRVFNPNLMRFQSPDGSEWSPFGKGGINPYGYGDGDPVNTVDPSGNFTLKFWTWKMPKFGSAPKVEVPQGPSSEFTGFRSKTWAGDRFTGATVVNYKEEPRDGVTFIVRNLRTPRIDFTTEQRKGKGHKERLVKITAWDYDSKHVAPMLSNYAAKTARGLTVERLSRLVNGPNNQPDVKVIRQTERKVGKSKADKFWLFKPAPTRPSRWD